LLAATKNGTIALAQKGKVTWHCVRGATARALPQYSITFILGVYPDGILVQPPGGIRKPDPPVTFISVTLTLVKGPDGHEYLVGLTMPVGGLASTKAISLVHAAGCRTCAER
jgi:hypothetical protein